LLIIVIYINHIVDFVYKKPENRTARLAGGTVFWFFNYAEVLTLSVAKAIQAMYRLWNTRKTRLSDNNRNKMLRRYS